MRNGCAWASSAPSAWKGIAAAQALHGPCLAPHSHPHSLLLRLLCSERPAVLANLSARVGSIGDNRLGGWHSYRASKSACNQLTKCAGGQRAVALLLCVHRLRLRQHRAFVWRLSAATHCRSLRCLLTWAICPHPAAEVQPWSLSGASKRWQPSCCTQERWTQICPSPSKRWVCMHAMPASGGGIQLAPFRDAGMPLHLI